MNGPAGTGSGRFGCVDRIRYRRIGYNGRAAALYHRFGPERKPPEALILTHEAKPGSTQHEVQPPVGITDCMMDGRALRLSRSCGI